METFASAFTGDFWAMLGAVVAFSLAAFGSAKGVRMAGEAAAGVLTEDLKKFGPVMVMEALASTQAIYGFVIAFLIIGKITDTELALQDGLFLFMAGIPIGIIGLFSGMFQGRVATAGINMLAKKPEGLGSAIILTLMVEMFAIIGFIVSILMLGKVIVA